MRIAVLGPLEVLSDDGAPVTVPGAKERLLLAVLAAAAPGVVSTDRLAESLWNGDPPVSARKSLQAHVVRLRSALEPDRPKGSTGRYVVRRGRVRAGRRPRRTSTRCGSAISPREGGRSWPPGTPTRPARLLGAAVELWRGEPYGDWPDAAFAEAERRRLSGRSAPRPGPTSSAPGSWSPAGPRRRGRHPIRCAPRQGGPRPRRPSSSWSPGLRRPHPRPTRRPRTRSRLPHPPSGGPQRRDGSRCCWVASSRRSWSRSSPPAVGAVRRERRACGDRGGGEPAGGAVGRGTPARRVVAAGSPGLPVGRHARDPARADGLPRRARPCSSSSVSFGGMPQEAAPTRRAPRMSYGTGGDGGAAGGLDNSVPRPHARDVLSGTARGVGTVTVVAPSTVDDLLMLARVYHEGRSWLRTAVTLDGTSPLHLEGDRLGGRPVVGVVTADGRSNAPDGHRAGRRSTTTPRAGTSSRIRDGRRGPRRTPGSGNSPPCPSSGCAATSPTTAASVVVWNGAGKEQDIAGPARQRPADPDPAASASAAELRLPCPFPPARPSSGRTASVTLVDDSGTTYEELSRPAGNRPGHRVSRRTGDGP